MKIKGAVDLNGHFHTVINRAVDRKLATIFGHISRVLRGTRRARPSSNHRRSSKPARRRREQAQV